MLTGVLHTRGIADRIIDRESGETAEQRLAKTNNRSVLGVTNEFPTLTDRRRDQITDPDDLTWLSLDPAHQPRPRTRRHRRLFAPDRDGAVARARRAVGL